VDENFSPRRIGLAVAALAFVLTIGMVGFHWSLDESWLQSFYRSVVTSALVGLDTVPQNDSSRILSIFMVFAGVTIFAFVASTLAESIARGVLTGALGEKRRRRAIEKLRDHIIICGYGRVGQQIAEEFRAAGAQYVVVDFHEDALEAARERGDYYIEGNATDDEDLRAAGLDRAKGLVAAADSDADNLYITLSGRAVNDDLLVVARASTSDASKKLRLAGADRVVEPYSAAGRVMANLMLKPQVTAFIDIVTTAASETDLRFEELVVPPDFAQAGQTIGQLRIRGKTGSVIIAVRKRDGHFETTPNPDMQLEPGDVIIAAGTDEELRLLDDLFRSAEAVAGR
jgi:voltage-gated potassium channel